MLVGGRRQGDFFKDVSGGFVAGQRVIHKFGGGHLIPTTFVPVTSSLTWQTPTTAQSLEVVSDDNINDVAAGTGARSVEIHGLTSWSGVEVIEIVALDGTTPVALTNQFLRIYRMKVVDSGQYGSQAQSSHDSTITVRGAGAGVVWGIISSLSGFGLGQSEIACFSIPAGQIAYIHDIRVYVEGNKEADIILFKRSAPDIIAAPFSPMHSVAMFKSLIRSAQIEYHYPLDDFTGPCDFGFMAKAITGTAAVHISFAIIVDTT